MINRRLAFIRQQQIMHHEEVPFELPYLKEAKHMTVKGLKKVGHVGLVSVLRLYFQSINFVKYRSKDLVARIKNAESENGNGEKKEISKFLKIVGDYKRKVREIKHRIKREEDL